MPAVRKSLSHYVERCVHCGRVIGTFEGGYGSVFEGVAPDKRLVRVCDPHVRGRPNCRRNITIDGHPVRDCGPCSEGAAGR